MDNINVKNVTATGASETPEPAVGGTRAPQKSSSPSSAESVDVLRQASTANHGVGNTTVGAGAKQACTGDRKVASATAVATSGNEIGTAAEILRAATKQLGSKLCTQQGGLDILFEKASHLEIVSKKSHSPTVSSAIRDLLDAVNVIQKNRVEVTSAFNHSLRCVKAMISTSDLCTPAKRECKDAATITVAPRAHVGRDTKDAATKHDSVSCQTDEAASPTTRVSETQTPCWWDLGSSALRQTEPGEGPGDRSRSRGQRRKRACQRQRQQQQRHQPRVEEHPDPLQQRQPREMRTEDAPGKAEASGEAAEGSGFTVVSRRKARGKSCAAEPKAAEIRNGSTGRRRVHRKQAVILERPPGSASYADMLKAAKAAVQEEKLSIDISARKAKSGNIVIEISGKEEADNLAGVLKAKMGSSVGVRRPSPSVSLRLTGIEDSIDEAELRSALTKFDGDLNEVKDIRIAEGKNGVRYTTVRAPLRAGLRLIDARKIKIGWAVCRVREFARETGRCDKCKEYGHTSKACTGPEKRKCFRCQAAGHLIADCSELRESGTESGAKTIHRDA